MTAIKVKMGVQFQRLEWSFAGVWWLVCVCVYDSVNQSGRMQVCMQVFILLLMTKKIQTFLQWAWKAVWNKFHIQHLLLTAYCTEFQRQNKSRVWILTHTVTLGTVRKFSEVVKDIEHLLCVQSQFLLFNGNQSCVKVRCYMFPLSSRRFHRTSQREEVKMLCIHLPQHFLDHQVAACNGLCNPLPVPNCMSRGADGPQTWTEMCVEKWII